MTRIDVLDHGFLELVDVMGNDAAIVDAARISISGENVKSVQTDEQLIRYLMRHRHTTPFEMVEFKFRAAMPMFVARQWVRHRTASINELSARYSALPAVYYVPDPADINHQAVVNKQGRLDEQMEDRLDHRLAFEAEAASSFSMYQQRLDANMARELARINLPLSTYTAWIWKANLHNIFHFLGLRAHAHAQMEIRVYAEAMAELVKEHVPIAYQAYEDYRVSAVTFTGPDRKAIRLIMSVDGVGLNDDRIRACFPTKREHAEFKTKWEELLPEGEQ